MPAADRTRVCRGRASGARGLKGEVRVKTFTEDPLSFGAYGALEDKAGKRTFEIENVTPAKDGVIARIRDITSREAAEALKGTEFYVSRDRLPETAEDGEYYLADLVGLVAVSADGAALGQVMAVQNFGAGDLLEVRPATGGKTVLVPFTQEIVPEVDLDGGWLLMMPPEGLFDE